MKTPQFLSIAKSSNGTIGLITSTEPVEHTYPEGKTVQVWKGVVIEENTMLSRDGENKVVTAKVGGVWTSSNPEVLGQIRPEQLPDLLAFEDKMKVVKQSRENETRTNELMTEA